MPKRVIIILAWAGIALSANPALPQPADQYMPGPLQGSLNLPPDAHGLFISFGRGVSAGAHYDGRITITGGAIHTLQGWQMTGDDRVVTTSQWEIQTKPSIFTNGQYPMQRAANRQQMTPWAFPKGVIAYYSGDAQSRLAVTTTAGDFTFLSGDVGYNRPLTFLGGRVRVERVPAATMVTGGMYEDDYPALCAGADGTVWMSYQRYRDEAEDVVVRQWRNGQWTEADVVSPARGDMYRTAIAQDGAGGIWVVWSERLGDNWDLYARRHVDGRWWDVIRLTTDPGPDMFHALAAGPDGQLYLVWQGFRGGQSDILLKRFNGITWQPEQRISTDPANDWRPALSVDRGGRVWISWDSYADGDYDVRMRTWYNGVLGEEIPVTTSNLFEANSSIVAGPDGRIWVAWEESGSNWGKDVNLFDVFHSPGQQQKATLLYQRRQVRVACYDGRRWLQPVNELMDAIPVEYRKFAQFPQLTMDADQRLWAFVRLRTRAVIDRRDGWASGGGWEIFAIPNDGDRWLPPVYLANSIGRNDVQVAHTFASGRLHLAWAGDSRPFTLRVPFHAANTLETSIFSASLPAPAVSLPAGTPVRMVLEPRIFRDQEAVNIHPNESADVRRIRNYTALVGDKAYKIYRGDTHRHTDISGDGAGEGSVIDLMRYALDAVQYDFMMVGDHDYGGLNEYHWWRTEKFLDLFHLTGSFTTLFGYERSVRYPNGHRNVAFATRGIHPLPISPEEMRGDINTGSVLYPWLRANNGIAFSHSSATTQGTDWRDSDPELEPIMELYQGYHINAEYVGAPLGLQKDAEGNYLTHSVHGQYREAGMYWEALKKGIRLGVMASSDHQSTHMSHCNIYAEDATREGLIEAMRQRHTYASTDNMIMDFRALDGDAEYFMGEEYTTRRVPRLRGKIIGTAPIKTLELIKNFTIALTLTPNRQDVDFYFMDTAVASGENFYYLRAIQEDGQIAWSSPIWVTYTP